jgi:hypothetical protein
MFLTVRRRLFNLCSIVSLLICMAVCALWLHGRQHADYVILTSPAGNDFGITSARGTVVFYRTTRFHPVAAIPSWHLVTVTQVWGYFHEDLAERAGENEYDQPVFARTETVEEISHKGTQVQRRQFLIVRHWLTVAVLAALPLWTFALRTLRRTRRAGFCGACGYDLRATPGRCPECGRVQEG